MAVGLQSWLGLVGLQLVLTLPAHAHPPAARPVAPKALHPTATPAPAIPDGRDPVGIATAFGEALAKGDEASVKSLLAEDVMIYESGGQESSREEYASHHMRSDMAFLAGTKSEMLERKHGGSADVAWVMTRSRIQGAYKGKPVDLFTTETLVLKRSPAGFRIVHIHWSSQPAQTKAKP